MLSKDKICLFLAGIVWGCLIGQTITSVGDTMPKSVITWGDALWFLFVLFVFVVVGIDTYKLLRKS